MTERSLVFFIDTSSVFLMKPCVFRLKHRSKIAGRYGTWSKRTYFSSDCRIFNEAERATKLTCHSLQIITSKIKKTKTNPFINHKGTEASIPVIVKTFCFHFRFRSWFNRVRHICSVKSLLCKAQRSGCGLLACRYRLRYDAYASSCPFALRRIQFSWRNTNTRFGGPKFSCWFRFTPAGEMALYTRREEGGRRNLPPG